MGWIYVKLGKNIPTLTSSSNEPVREENGEWGKFWQESKRSRFVKFRHNLLDLSDLQWAKAQTPVIGSSFGFGWMMKIRDGLNKLVIILEKKERRMSSFIINYNRQSHPIGNEFEETQGTNEWRPRKLLIRKEGRGAVSSWRWFPSFTFLGKLINGKGYKERVPRPRTPGSESRFAWDGSKDIPAQSRWVTYWLEMETHVTGRKIIIPLMPPDKGSLSKSKNLFLAKKKRE